MAGAAARLTPLLQPFDIWYDGRPGDALLCPALPCLPLTLSQSSYLPPSGQTEAMLVGVPLLVSFPLTTPLSLQGYLGQASLLVPGPSFLEINDSGVGEVRAWELVLCWLGS